jgi:terminase large subunit-like protein
MADSMSIADTYSACGLNPSPAQLCLAKLVLGEELSTDELQIAYECTGRADLPELGFSECTCIVGRKGGKTEYVAAPLLIHRAVNDDDEPGVYLLVAPSKSDQATIGWQAIVRQVERGFPNLIQDIKESEGQILLHTGNVIKIASANFRSLRGPKYKVVVIDECCFFVSDDPELGFSNPLEYVLDSVVGGMVATENPLLLLQSTPWVKDGVVWEQYRDRALNPERLVWRAPTLTMNPFANRALMEKHRRDRGENFYQREYMAQFSEDANPYIDPADVDLAIAPNAAFFPIRPNCGYVMGLDPGRKRDHFGAAIAHRENNAVVVDWSKEWKPGLFSGLKYADILPEIWAKAREYRVRKIASDQIDFGGIEASIPIVSGRPEFKLERIMSGGDAGAEMCDTTRALFAQHNLILPNQPGLADEFKRLADYLTQGGSRDVRAKRGHDDRSRAVMLAIYQAWNRPVPIEPWVEIVTFNVPRPIPPEVWNKPPSYDPFDDTGFRPRVGPASALAQDQGRRR